MGVRELPGRAFDFRFQEFAREQAGHRGVVLDELKFDVERLLHEILHLLGQRSGLSRAIGYWRFIGGVLPLVCDIGVLFWVRRFVANHWRRTPSLFLLATKPEYSLSSVND